MLRQILKQAFWDTYDHLGRLIAINFVLLLTVVPAWYYGVVSILALAAVLPAAWHAPILLLAVPLLSALLLAAPLAGLLHFAALVSREKDPSLRDFARGIRACGWRVLRFALLWSLVLSLLAINAWFYIASGLIPPKFAFAGYIAGGLCVWLALFIGMVGVHILPLLARDSAGGLGQCLRTGFLLALKYPRATLGTLAVIACLLVLGAVLKLAGVVLYGFYAPAILANSLHDVMAQAETGITAQTADPASARLSSWKEIRTREDQKEEHRLSRARYERTFRDLLKPWEM